MDKLSNAELLELSKNASKLHPDAGVVKLTSNTVAKPSQDMDEDAPDPSEATALDLVFSQTTIPIPRVRRVVRRKWDFLIIMDHIPGPTLAHVWPTLPAWRKCFVAFTLRRYVRQLRRVGGNGRQLGDTARKRQSGVEERGERKELGRQAHNCD